jgi:hypothetical protein
MDRFEDRETLDKSLKQSTKKLGLGITCIFQHENHPKHTSMIAKKCLQEDTIEALKYRAYSLGLNHIEHIRDELERRMKKNQPNI